MTLSGRAERLTKLGVIKPRRVFAITQQAALGKDWWCSFSCGEAGSELQGRCALTQLHLELLSCTPWISRAFSPGLTGLDDQRNPVSQETDTQRPDPLTEWALQE